MGLFDRGRAGEWAAMAMGCMCFADGSAAEAEIAAAKAQAATNPLLKRTIGSKKAEKLFQETVDAIGAIPSAMLPTYETKLATLAADVDDPNDKNFALATVIAVAMGDQTLSQPEYGMLLRFKEMLGASIPVPTPGAQVPAQYLRPPQMPGGEPGAIDDEAAVTPAAPVAEKAAAAAAQPAAAKPATASGPVPCATCGKPTQNFPGYGHWCGDCQRYTAEPAAAASSAATPAAPAALEVAAVSCPTCGKPTQLYPGYGSWCAGCQKYA